MESPRMRRLSERACIARPAARRRCVRPAVSRGVRRWPATCFAPGFMQAPYRKAFQESRGRQMTTRRHPVHSLALVALVAMAFVADARAQGYPNRPVTFVVP